MKQMSKSAKKTLKSNTFGSKHNPFLFTDFQKYDEAERHTYYDDPLDPNPRDSHGSVNTGGK